MEIKIKPVVGRIIAARCVEIIKDPTAYMDVTIRIPRGLGAITIGKRMLVDQSQMDPVDLCKHEGRTMAGGCLDCGDPSF